VGALALAVGCGGSAEPIVDCSAAGGVTPICGLANPEDLVSVPGSRWLIVSQMRTDGRGGSLATVSIGGDGPLPVFPPRLFPPTVAPEGSLTGPATWGTPDCPGPPDPDLFAPHGLDLAPRPDGVPALLVVNHGGRESIELFEVTHRDPPEVAWRGCVVLPGRAQANDVAALGDGGFVVTNMLPRSGALGSVWLMLRTIAGWNTGYLIEWEPGTGWRQIPNSKASVPNGLAVSSDGTTLYFAAFGSSELIRLRRADGENRVSVPLPRPDNLTWADDGRLLVAAHTAPLTELLGCARVESGTCGAPFGIYAVDAATLETRIVFKHGRGAPMGAASVALQVEDQLILGSFVGDRIGRARFPG
jgi:hypothetical protein